MKKILILTQDEKNTSVKSLVRAFESKKDKGEQYEIVVWGINGSKDIVVEKDKIFLVEAESGDSLFFRPEPKLMHLSELSLVIKRTWSSTRERVLQVCKELESRGIHILNGCKFIEWCHSKITQYEGIKDRSLVPIYIAFDQPYIYSINDSNQEEKLSEILEKTCKVLSFPLIFKTAKGCRGDGVYLVDSKNSLESLLRILLENKERLEGGFILQAFIRTHENPSISSYFRINIVGGKAQSAAQFQYMWKSNKNGLPEGIRILEDFADADDKPVRVELFGEANLGKLVDECLCKDGVVGADVIFSGSKMYILEFNSGPSIWPIVKLGIKHESNPNLRSESIQCIEFATSIAELCYQLCEEEPSPDTSFKINS